MSYQKKDWKDLPDITTPVTATDLDRMEEGIADANGAIGIDAYDSTSTYAVNDLCIYNNTLYICTTAITTAEAFNSAHWQIISIIKAAILASHPVGSYYWSSKSTSPATLFGGTWTRVTDKFVLAAGSTYTAGATGGAATVTLTTSQIPSHTHTFTGNALPGHSHRVLIHGCGVEATGFGLTNSNFFKDNVKTGTTAENGDLSASASAGTPSGTNSNTGGGKAHNNMPPYEVAYCWKRTA